MDEYYLTALENKWLNDGISYLTVEVEKGGKIYEKKFEIDEQEEDIWASVVDILSKLVKQGCKIVDFKILRYFEY